MGSGGTFWIKWLTLSLRAVLLHYWELSGQGLRIGRAGQMEVGWRGLQGGWMDDIKLSDH